VASFIQRRANTALSLSKGLAPLQFLVISLKDSFFSQADLLVGIFRDAATVCSRRMCLDLTTYGPQQQQQQQQQKVAARTTLGGKQAAKPVARRGEEEEEEEEGEW
jgi:hypothetical protein